MVCASTLKRFDMTPTRRAKIMVIEEVIPWCHSVILKTFQTTKVILIDEVTIVFFISSDEFVPRVGVTGPSVLSSCHRSLLHYILRDVLDLQTKKAQEYEGGCYHHDSSTN